MQFRTRTSPTAGAFQCFISRIVRRLKTEFCGVAVLFPHRFNCAGATTRDLDFRTESVQLQRGKSVGPQVDAYTYGLSATCTRCTAGGDTGCHSPPSSKPPDEVLFVTSTRLPDWRAHKSTTRSCRIATGTSSLPPLFRPPPLPAGRRHVTNSGPSVVSRSYCYVPLTFHRKKVYSCVETDTGWQCHTSAG